MPDEAAGARTHLALAMGLFLLGVAALAQAPTPTGLLRAAPLVALGAFPVLIAGTSRMLLSGLARRTVAGPARLALLPAALMALGAVGAWTLPAQGLASLLAAVVWAAGVASYVVVVTLTARSRRPVPRDGPERWTMAAVLHAAAAAYALVAALAVPLAAAGLVAWPVAFHVVLPGFVVCTLVGVALQVLPRFTGGTWPRWTSWAVAAAVPAPALLAAGLTASRPLFLAGAALEATALGGFAVATLVLLGRRTRRRPADLAYAGAVLAVLGGVGLGLGFALDPLLQRYVPVHATLNLLGFVGLFVLGASQDLYAPALRPGRDAARRHALVVTGLAAAGLALAAAGLTLGAAESTGLSVPVARLGFISYLAALGVHLAGAIAAQQRTPGRLRLHAAPRRGSTPDLGGLER